MNLFTAVSSSDDEENERPLRSFIPQQQQGPQQILPWKWGLPGEGDEEDEEEEREAKKKQTTTANKSKASAPAAGPAAARAKPPKPLASPTDDSKSQRREKKQGATPLGKKRPLVLQPPPATAATATKAATENDGGAFIVGDDETPTVKEPQKTRPAPSPSPLLNPPGVLTLHVTSRAVSGIAKEDTFLVEISSRPLDVAGASGVVGRSVASRGSGGSAAGPSSASKGKEPSAASGAASFDLLGQVYDLQLVPCASTLMLVTVPPPPPAAAKVAAAAAKGAVGGEAATGDGGGASTAVAAAAAATSPLSGAANQVAKVEAVFPLSCAPRGREAAEMTTAKKDLALTFIMTTKISLGRTRRLLR